MIGTAINAGAILVGSIAGTLIGNRMPDKMRSTVMDGLGLATLVIGAQMAFQTANILIVLGSILIGGIIGECLNIENALNRLGIWVESRISASSGAGGAGTGRIARGFVAASLLFCVGPMAIVGSIQDGLSGDYSVLAVKATLDGFAALAFSSSLGAGVALSALSVTAYQGAITLAAGTVQRVLTEAMTKEMTATGGVLILAISLMLLEVKKVRVANLLPAIFVAPLLSFLVTSVRPL